MLQQALGFGVGLLQAALLAYGVLVFAHACSARALPRESALVRWAATAVVAATTCSVLFHALIALSAFRVGWVLLASAVLLAACRVRAGSLRALHAPLRRDRRALVRLARRASRGRAGAVCWLYGAFALAVLARCLVVPPVAWDTLTYHYVKAAMWVQAGGPIPFSAPGPWTIYGPRLGGGEVYSAFAMLPFHSDALAGLVDFGWWAATGLALSLLGREFGLRGGERLQVAMYGVSIPSLSLAVGTGYVDATATALLLLGLFFGVRHLRARRAGNALVIALLAFALAASVKLTAAAVAAVATVALLVLAFAAGRQRESPGFARLAFGTIVGSTLGALVVLPWLLQNVLAFGQPFELPLSLFGRELGAELPALDWYRSGRTIAGYDPAIEFWVLSNVFAAPWIREPQLSLLSIAPLLLSPLGVLRLFRSRRVARAALVLYVATALAVIAVFYAPGFGSVRVLWSWSSGRFLAPAVLLALPLSVAALPRDGAARKGLTGYLAIATLVHVGSFAIAGWSPAIAGWCAVAGSILAVFCVGSAVALDGRSVRHRQAARAALIAAVLGAILVVPLLRATETRYSLIRTAAALGGVEKYWVRGAKLLDRPGESLRIAVTAGDDQDADNWFLYPFLGTRLANTLHYVPISRSGEFIEFGPASPRRQQGDYESWIARLRAARISHVVSFDPASVELDWMLARPLVFERLGGTPGHWGVFSMR